MRLQQGLRNPNLANIFHICNPTNIETRNIFLSLSKANIGFGL